MLQLLAGVSSEYQEAFDEQGKVVRPMDIDETRLLLAEVRDVAERLTATGDPGLKKLLSALSTLVDEQVPPAVVTAFAEVLRRYLIQWTGVRETIVPQERPSLARGRELFQENCVGCHGVTGAGDGADVKRLGITPADFTDLAFMRGQTPRDIFNVITLGRQGRGMPSWGEALSAQQVWDLVGYIWSLGRTAASLAAGQRIYEAQCAGCHGATGDPADVLPTAGVHRPPRSLSALLQIAERSDSDLFAIVSNGGRGDAMPAFAPRLGEDERWAVVTFARTLSHEGAPGAAAQPMEPDRGAQMAEVRRLLDAARDAQRRGDPAAIALATNAYVRLEPLEKPLAEIDEVHLQDMFDFDNSPSLNAVIAGGGVSSGLVCSAEPFQGPFPPCWRAVRRRRAGLPRPATAPEVRRDAVDIGGDDVRLGSPPLHRARSRRRSPAMRTTHSDPSALKPPTPLSKRSASSAPAGGGAALECGGLPPLWGGSGRSGPSPAHPSTAAARAAPGRRADRNAAANSGPWCASVLQDDVGGELVDAGAVAFVWYRVAIGGHRPQRARQRWVCHDATGRHI